MKRPQLPPTAGARRPDRGLAEVQRAVELLNAGLIPQAAASARKALAGRPNDPSALNVLGCVALQDRRFVDAQRLFERAAARQPSNPFLAANLGQACASQGELEQAAAHLGRAIDLDASLVGAAAALGDIFIRLDRWPQAEAAFDKALATDPNHGPAHYGRGLCRRHRGDLPGALSEFKAALKGRPEMEPAARSGVLANAAQVQLQLGRGLEGLQLLTDAITATPERDALWRLMANSLRNVRVAPATLEFEIILSRLFDREDINPRSLATAAVVVLARDERLGPALERLPTGELTPEALHRICEAAADSPLLLALLRTAPIPDARLELALTELRRQLLLTSGGSWADQPRSLQLAACALARQCWLNEHVYAVDEDEHIELRKLVSRVLQGSAADWWDVVRIACYLPLAGLGLEALDREGAPEMVVQILQEHLDETKLEALLADALPRLGAIEDATSLAVRAQYEENPYPRWTRLGRSGPQPFADALQARLQSPTLADDAPSTPIRALIAGCGTGLEIFRVIDTFECKHCLAVDLSRRSLAYSARKLAEAGVDHVELVQADILELGRLSTSFDFIDSFGVIHHMADPAGALRILSGRLRVGGHLFLGLYSTIARASVRAARDAISALNLPPTSAAIRAFRRKVLVGPTDLALAPLASPASDFWTLSEARDLMFHAEEHQFTLLEIETMFDAAGLAFLGLELPYGPDRERFIEEEGSAALGSLRAWHAFELRHPETFGGTYRLWARKI